MSEKHMFISSDFTLISLFSEKNHSLKSEHIHSFLFRDIHVYCRFPRIPSHFEIFAHACMVPLLGIIRKSKIHHSARSCILLHVYLSIMQGSLNKSQLCKCVSILKRGHTINHE